MTNFWYSFIPDVQNRSDYYYFITNKIYNISIYLVHSFRILVIRVLKTYACRFIKDNLLIFTFKVLNDNCLRQILLFIKSTDTHRAYCDAPASNPHAQNFQAIPLKHPLPHIAPQVSAAYPRHSPLSPVRIPPLRLAFP